MSLEIEVKYLDVEHDALRQRLESLDAEPLGRWFEANAVFDDPERSLKARGTLLRLREKSGRHILTLKRAAEGHPSGTAATAKVYEESETEVLDPAELRAILTGLGYTPVLRYEKIREKWRLFGCEVCLDTLPIGLPFGLFLEIEGPEADIARCAAALNLPPEKASTATYHDLNRQWRAEKGLAPDETFVFTVEDKTRLLSGRATAN